jgi:hypothetical protein
MDAPPDINRKGAAVYAKLLGDACCDITNNMIASPIATNVVVANRSLIEKRGNSNEDTMIDAQLSGRPLNQFLDRP